MSKKLLENCGKRNIGAEPFSSKNNKIMDHMIGFYNTDYGLLVTLQALKQRLDKMDEPSRMFILAKLWRLYLLISALGYKSETAKSTLKTKMARLMGKQSI